MADAPRRHSPPPAASNGNGRGPARGAERATQVQGLRERLRRCLDAPASRDRLGAARELERYFASCLESLERNRLGDRATSVAFQYLNEILEDRIRRIAHELHDDAGQILATVYISLADLERSLPRRARPRLEVVRGHLDRVHEQIRRLAHELRPAILDDLGLVPALRFLCEGVSSRNGLRVELEASTGGRLPPSLESALYRIVQEAITNVARHSHARHATVRLRRVGHELRCTIRDDGFGFAPRDLERRDGERGFGLTGIEARLAAVGGNLRIDTAPHRGTKLVATIPLEDGGDATHPPG